MCSPYFRIGEQHPIRVGPIQIAGSRSDQQQRKTYPHSREDTHARCQPYVHFVFKSHRTGRVAADIYLAVHELLDELEL